MSIDRELLIEIRLQGTGGGTGNGVGTGKGNGVVGDSEGGTSIRDERGNALTIRSPVVVLAGGDMVMRRDGTTASAEKVAWPQFYHAVVALDVSALASLDGARDPDTTVRDLKVEIAVLERTMKNDKNPAIDSGSLVDKPGSQLTESSFVGTATPVTPESMAYTEIGSVSWLKFFSFQKRHSSLFDRKGKRCLWRYLQDILVHLRILTPHFSSMRSNMDMCYSAKRASAKLRSPSPRGKQRPLKTKK